MSGAVLASVLTGEGTWRTPTRRDGRITSQRLSIDPLRREVEQRGGYARVTRHLDRTVRVRLERAWLRALSTGTLTWRAADQFAVELFGVHPSGV